MQYGIMQCSEAFNPLILDLPSPVCPAPVVLDVVSNEGIAEETFVSSAFSDRSCLTRRKADGAIREVNSLAG